MNTLITKEEYNKLHALRTHGASKYASVFAMFLGAVMMIISGINYLRTGDIDTIWIWFLPGLISILLGGAMFLYAKKKIEKHQENNKYLKPFFDHITTGTKLFLYEEHQHGTGKRASFSYTDYMIVFEEDLISIYDIGYHSEFLGSFSREELFFEFNYKENKLQEHKLRMYVGDDIEPVIYDIFYELIEPLKTFLIEEGYNYREKYTKT